MGDPAAIIVGSCFAVLGVTALVRPGLFRWTPLYRFYAHMLDETRGLTVVRFSLGLGACAAAVMFLLLGAGIIG